MPGALSPHPRPRRRDHGRLRRPRDTARGGRQRGQRRRLHQTGEVQAAGGTRRRGRRGRRLRGPRGLRPGDDAAHLPPLAPPEGPERHAGDGRLPPGQERRRHRPARPRRDGRQIHVGGAAGRPDGGGRALRRRPGRQGRPGERGPGLEGPQGPGVRAAGRARRGARRRPRTQVGGRRGPRGLPVVGQVVADRGDELRAPQDRGLPLHDPGSQPGRRGGRGRALHDGRRAGPDSRRLHGQGPGPGLPAPHRALRGHRPRARHRRLRGRAHARRRPAHHRGRAGRLPGRPGRAGGPRPAHGAPPRHRAQQSGRARRAGPGRDRPPRTGGDRVARVRGLRRLPRGAAGAVLRAGGDRGARARPAPRP